MNLVGYISHFCYILNHKGTQSVQTCQAGHFHWQIIDDDSNERIKALGEI